MTERLKGKAVQDAGMPSLKEAFRGAAFAASISLAALCAAGQPAFAYKNQAKTADAGQSYVIDRRVVDACASPNFYIIPRVEFDNCVDLSILAKAPYLLRYEKDPKAIEIGVKRYGEYELNDRSDFISIEWQHLPYVVSLQRLNEAQIGDQVRLLQKRIISENEKAEKDGTLSGYFAAGGPINTIEGLLLGGLFIAACIGGLIWQRNRM